MVINVNATPNPLSYQFTSEKPFVEFGHHAFYEADQSTHCPIAQELLSVVGIDHILITPMFLTVTLKDPDSWTHLESAVSQIVKKHCESLPLVVKSDVESSEPQDELWHKVSELIETHVTPAIASHGGFIKLQRIENSIVFVELQGACDSCPSALVTLKDGIENLLKFYIPTIQEVRSTN